MRSIKIGRITLSLTFISLGILFFIRNLVSYNLIDLLSLFWPIIIIFFGLEILYIRNKYKDNEKIIKFDRISTTFILLFIVSFSTTTISTSNHPKMRKMIGANLNYKYSDDIEEEVILNKNKKLLIEDSNIDIYINKNDEKEIKVKLEGVCKYNEKGEYEKDLNLINISNYGKTTKLSRYFKNKGRNNRKIKLEDMKYLVLLPEGVDLEIINKFGDIDIVSVKSNIDIYSESGDVLLKLPKEQNGKFNIIAAYGNIYDELNFNVIESASTSSISEIRNTIEPAVNIRTNNGDIILKTD